MRVESSPEGSKSGATCQRVSAAFDPIPWGMMQSPVVPPARAASCRRRPPRRSSGWRISITTKESAPLLSASSATPRLSLCVSARARRSCEGSRKGTRPRGYTVSWYVPARTQSAGSPAREAAIAANVRAEGPQTSWTRAWRKGKAVRRSCDMATRWQRRVGVSNIFIRPRAACDPFAIPPAPWNVATRCRCCLNSSITAPSGGRLPDGAAARGECKA